MIKNIILFKYLIDKVFENIQQELRVSLKCTSDAETPVLTHFHYRTHATKIQFLMLTEKYSFI